MGDHVILAITDIMPEEILSDDEMGVLKEKVIEAIKPLKTTLEAAQYVPIAFGLRKITCRLVIPEETQGGTQPVEDAINAIEGVQRCEIGMVSRQ